MSPRIVESKLIITGEDKASESLKKIEEGLGKVAEKLAALRDIEIPSFEGTAVGRTRRGVGKTGVGSQRSSHAPTARGGLDLTKVRQPEETKVRTPALPKPKIVEPKPTTGEYKFKDIELPGLGIGPRIRGVGKTELGGIERPERATRGVAKAELKGIEKPERGAPREVGRVDKVPTILKKIEEGLGKFAEKLLVVRIVADKASISLKKVEGGLGRVAAEAVKTSESLKKPEEDFGKVEEGVRAARGVGKVAAAGAPRSPHAPTTGGQVGLDAVKARGGTGWGGKPYFGWRGTGAGAAALGMAGRAPSMAAGVVGGVMTGGGLREVGSLMSQVGGGVMGAFGGFGAMVGLPLLAAGAVFGLARMMAEPTIQYRKATYGVAARMGRGFVEKQRAAGIPAGIGPMEMAGILGQLESVGAQRGFGTLEDLRAAGITQELAIPAITAITRAGGAGARGPQDYENIKRALLGTAKDVHSIPEMLEQVRTAIEIVGENVGDTGVGGAQATMALAKWLQGGPSAALRGPAGGRLLGGMMGAIATPGPPGKELFLWGALGKEPGLREAFKTAYPHLAYMMPETGGLTRFQLQLLRETRGGADALPTILKRIMPMGPKLAPEMLRGMFPMLTGIRTAEVMERYRATGGIPEDLQKTLEEELKPAEEHLKDIAKSTAAIESKKIDLVDVEKILGAELTVMDTMSVIVKGKAFTAAIDSLPKMAEALDDLSKGEFGKFFDKMVEAVSEGVRQGFGGSKTTLQERARSEGLAEYQASYNEALKYGVPPPWDPGRARGGYTSGAGQPGVEAPAWIKEWVKSWSGTRPR